MRGVSGSNAGYSVSAAGDVNGDGIDDLIVGAPYATVNSLSGVGLAYVIFGSTDGVGTLTGGRMVLTLGAMIPSQGFVIQGDTTGDNLGWSVSGVGDLNGDDIDDIIVGARNGDDGDTNAGEAYVIYGFQTVDTAAGQVLVGTGAANFFAGSEYADNLTGGGGADVLFGYSGNDILTVSDTSFQRIDGGAGHDKLILSGSGLHLDLTALASDVVTNIETIDITGTGNNTLTFAMQDLLDLSSTTDTLIVDGNAGDTVRAIGFIDSGTDETVNSITYDVYTNGTAILWLDQEITNVTLV
jgi:Ca2+-binding RTX toxin-like protein